MTDRRSLAPALLNAIPVLAGVFAGAPILARELDSGTFRFAWTQGAGRTRWTLARLALPAVTVTAAAAAFTQLFGWFFYPFFAVSQAGSFAPQYFNLTGIAFAAWTPLTRLFQNSPSANVRHGYIQWTTYQPAIRYWHFQLIEGGWLLALSLLLIAATIWLVRRRAA